MATKETMPSNLILLAPEVSGNPIFAVWVETQNSGFDVAEYAFRYSVSERPKISAQQLY